MGSPGRSLLTASNVNATTGAGVGTDESTLKMVDDIGVFLIPKIKGLSGLHAYFAGASPTGSIVNVSLWESEAAAEQMGVLKEMIVDARRAAEALGVRNVGIVNYPISWWI
jgi:hypothetical protein